MSRSRSRKRVKLELGSPSTPTFFKSEPHEPQLEQQGLEEEEEDEDRCSICLQEVADRTVVPICAHEFCFDCLLVWTAQSRRCPLCSQGIGPFLIHKIRSRYDYQKHYLAPLPTSPVPLRPLPLRQVRPVRRRQRDREWGRRDRTDSDEADKLDRSIAKRRWIYEHDLYAKHVASNAYTRYRPYPTPAQFAASPDLISRTTMFLRRELQVWVNLDVEFLTTFIISIMKALDIRSESAVKLLSEFLDLDAPYVEGGRHVNAEHFAHEVYTYVRSPYKDLFVYDSVAQYEIPPDVPALTEEPRRRWRESSRSRSPQGSPRDARAEAPRRVRSRSRSSSNSRSSRRRATSREKQLDDHTSRGAGQQLCDTSRHRTSNERPKSNGNIDTGAGETPIHSRPDYPLPPTPVTTENTETLISKGKARSIPRVVPSEEEISMAATPLLDDSPADVIVSPLAAPARQPPRIRNRSLFESVQAHLAGPSRKQRETTQSTLHDSGDPSKLVFETDSTPALLGRLSDPDTATNIQQKGLSDKSRTRILEAAVSALPVARANASVSGAERGGKPSLSAPEIMARTRARLAKSAATPGNAQSQESLSADGGACTAPSLSAPLSLDSRRRQDGNGDMTISAGETPRRAKLLGRLEEEKQKARGVVDSAEDRISQEEQPIPIPFPVAVTTSTPVDAAAAEARLRRQAQLRVRLAAEKRQHAREA
ncbi:hypothetical protein DFH06DRAFT_250133 [Mycena polygramma]|nr:hypothetical protein DFH06DRAFT_250133 [Mycena polygramma]